MALPDSDSARRPLVRLRVRRHPDQGITEVTGLKMEQDVIELKQNTPDGKYVVKKLPGRPKAGRVTLTRALTEDNSFDEWVKDAQVGKMGDARKGGASSSTTTRVTPIKRYKLTNAWPKSLEIGALKAGDTNVLTEKLVAHLRGDASRRVRRGTTPQRSATREPPDGEPRGRAPTRCGPSSSSCCPAATSTPTAPCTARASMRLATARDELVPLRDDRVRENPAYLTVVLLGRVVTRSARIDDVHAGLDREPVRLRSGVPAGPLPASEPGGPHPGRAWRARHCDSEFTVDFAGGRLGES